MKKLLLSILVLGLTNVMYAYKLVGHLGPRVDSDTDSRAAGCSPANEKIFMEFNNIRALVETGGSLWQDRSNSRSSYEYPKDSRNHVIFSGALWMGGEDINGQLKLAAHMFRQGNDFWPGPLGDLIAGTGNYNPFVPQNADATLVRDYGAAEVFTGTCTEYDRFFTITKAEVVQYVAWWKCNNGETDPEDCDGVVLDEIVRQKIEDWPAHGVEALGQDFYLAPFYDNAKEGETPNGIYDPINDGDYPWYDLEEEVDCRNDRRVTLFGDETHWWVFNDKGNIHTESGGDPIGMEVRAQAFSFATDDEINDMTFYNYELINRGTQTLFETYFGQWVDSDIGFGLNDDDYIGCDVARGLGYCYNGDLNDEGGGNQPGYGANPPAVGVDFFEGPYLDNDNLDNPLYRAEAEGDLPAVLLPEVFANDGIPYPGLGIGYGDGVVDNERFGMQRFVYHERDPGPYGDPSSAADFYNYLRGVWKNGLNMQFGGNGNTSGSGVPTKFMYPDDSDPLGWGTYPSPLPSTDPWNEISVGNPRGDRRFLQSAGPFILRPGAVNNITVGVVIGQSNESDLEAPIRALKTADTKAQALFDNCFELVEPPFAPVLTIQEMENELILFLTDPAIVPPLEEYTEEDNINIITPDELAAMGIFYDNLYRFEGFQIFQMVDDLASITELADLAKARLVAQSDLENGIGKLVNYTYDEELDISIPAVMVEPVGEFELDGGLRRSFRVTEDLFATGNRTLVNHKKYYFLAVSYAYNQYKEYDPNDPTLLDGQKIPYLRSRIQATGGGIEAVVGIPHDPSPEADGRIFTTSYGFQPEITQIEGQGNGGTFLELTSGTVTDIIANNNVDHPIYQSGAGPIDIKVIDPLNLKGGDYTLGFVTDSSDIDSTTWWLEKFADGERDTVWSYGVISLVREQLIMDWGISVQVNQQYYIGASFNTYTEPIGASIAFKDSSKMWLSFVEDNDAFYPSNWIRVGNSEEAVNHNTEPNQDCVPDRWFAQPCHYDDGGLDKENQLYEQLLDGGIAPFKFVAKAPYGSPFGFPLDDTDTPWFEPGSIETWFTTASSVQNQISLADLHGVDIIITEDRTKWTRCPVLEINNIVAQTEHQDGVITPRRDLSVDKDGLSLGDAGYNATDGGSVDATGMGWFPGYAIDVITGTRLNMAFSENSWLKGDNGDDMIWNPTSSYSDNSGTPLFGGMHYVYVFGADVDGEGVAYDKGAWLRDLWKVDDSGEGDNGDYRIAWKTCFWVMEPLLTDGQELMATDVKISARINKPYREREVNGENESFPLYQFSFDNPSIVGDADRLASVLDNINIVPNPYYAYSEYETGKRDNRVKITNLPERCEVTIFNMQGSLVRNYVKDDPLTSIDWDLSNHQGIPIAGGLYIVHITIEIPDETGSLQEYERVLKWYGVLRQPDLDNL